LGGIDILINNVGVDDFVQDKWDSFDGYVEREERE
jgi:hypothetical protein